MTQGNIIGYNLRTSRGQRTRWPARAGVPLLPSDPNWNSRNYIGCAPMVPLGSAWGFSALEPLQHHIPCKHTPLPALTLASTGDWWVPWELWDIWRSNPQCGVPLRDGGVQSTKHPLGQRKYRHATNYSRRQYWHPGTDKKRGSSPDPSHTLLQIQQ